MKLWLLKRQYGRFEVLDFSDDQGAKFFSENFKGIPMPENLSPVQIETFKKGVKSDFPSGLLLPPVFSERAVQVLGELLKGKVELLPLHTVKNERYYAGNVINVLDCIDADHSEVKRFSDGLIMEYTKYVFIKETVERENIFKIRVHDSKKILINKVFVSDLFRERVLESGLKGFDFIKVWDSEKAATGEEEGPNPYLVDTSFGTTYSFEEATNLVMNQNKTVASDKWAMRLDENKELQVGQLQEDGSYLWLNPIYYPPIFLGMKWKVL
ncbi:hypothetical protein QNH20_12890 [Neobacillus sp. WH10]|uniref:imm11 family protein n=1 Tax=Neobacillus sp. WH10 TaxID=3047873 RepID=UPI0024C1E5D0|nr:DUF1629 domain-containing protein [Neobacillus sp. WH10]WHY79977.1 hypothetical protein QNH20_12890 [Neobacillus sp. WH10]